MKFGIRKPSVRKRIAAQTSVKRVLRQSLGLKVPRGYGWLTNPKKAAYNRIYNRTTKDGCSRVLLMFLIILSFMCTIYGSNLFSPSRTGTIHTLLWGKEDDQAG